MAAKDYVFQTGIRNVYLAKKTKSKTLMSQDRRVVENNEIIALFEHYLTNFCIDNKAETLICKNSNGEVIFEATIKDKLLEKVVSEIKEQNQ